MMHCDALIKLANDEKLWVESSAWALKKARWIGFSPFLYLDIKSRCNLDFHLKVGS